MFDKVEVDWNDAHSHSGWCDSEVAKLHNICPCHSVGYLIKETDTSMTLAESVSDNDGVADTICIPKGCITAVRKVAILDEHIGRQRIPRGNS